MEVHPGGISLKVAEYGKRFIVRAFGGSVGFVRRKEGEYMRWPAVWPCGKSFYSLQGLERIFSLIIVKIFTKSNSKYLYYANILKKNVGERKCLLICNACGICGRTTT